MILNPGDMAVIVPAPVDVDQVIATYGVTMPVDRYGYPDEATMVATVRTGLIDYQPAPVNDYEVIECRHRLGADGGSVTQCELVRYGGDPVLYWEFGHEIDSYWFPPELSRTVLVGPPAGWVEAVSQAAWVAARAA